MDCVASTPGRIRISVTDTGAGIDAGAADAAVPAVQPARTGGERRGRHGHRPRRVQAAGRIDGRRHRRGKHGRQGQRVLDRADADGRAADRRHARGESTALAQAPVEVGAQLRTLLYVEDNPANLMLVEDLIARRPDIRLLSARGRRSRHRDRARLPAGRDPDGHQPARHQRHRGAANPGATTRRRRTFR